MPVTTEKVAMTHLPIHPYTGLHAIGMRRDGHPIWPVRGGDGTTPLPPGNPPVLTPPPVNPPVPPAPAAPPAGDPSQVDPPLGPAGERALAAEREARKALEKELASLAPLKQFAAALGGTGQPGNGKSEVDLLNERFAAHEQTLADERAARWRAEVAHEKGLTPQQAARLSGGTRDELLADADELLKLFPAPPAAEQGKGRGPKPDRSQGSRSGASLSGREQGLAEAQKRFGKPAATQNTR